MLTILELRDNQYVIHNESGEEYEIIDTELQVKCEDGFANNSWQPAVSYRKKVAEKFWREQTFVRPMHEFMKKFSVKKVPDETNNHS